MANSKYQKNRRYHIVYETINLVNNNIYIGAHSTDDLSDDYLGSGDNILRAINKHGRENFKREILYIFPTSEEMFLKEASIVDSEFIRRKDVYNIIVGGYGGYNKGSKGLKHMHKKETGERCAVHESAISKMIDQGWVLGRNMSSTTDTIWIYKDQSKKMIKPTLLNEFEKEGWTRGLPKSPTSGKKWIYNPKTDKYSLCEKSDIDNKLSEGWIIKKWNPIPKGTSPMKYWKNKN
jgi:hypothetical protein